MTPHTTAEASSRARLADLWSRYLPWIATAARLYLAIAVWFRAGWPKFVDVEGTVRSVRAFQILPESLVRPMAYGLPVLELGLGLLLLIGLGTRIAAGATAVMMTIFMGAIAWAWVKGLSIDCGCFGNTGTFVNDPVPGYIKDLLRDTGFLLLAALLVRWPHTRFGLDGRLGLTRG